MFTTKKSLARLVAILGAAFLGVATLGTAAPATPQAGSGYWMLGVDGTVYTFGSAVFCGDLDVSSADSYGADIVATPDGKGYWALDGENYVDFFYCGSEAEAAGYEWNNFFAEQLRAGEYPTSMSALPDGSGYWVFTDHGRALPFGNARSYGDMSGIPLNGDIVDSVATPSGLGYWMLGDDGGIFSFGDAAFFGSMGGRALNAPINAMAPDPDGRGYWLVAGDGGIFAFDAPFYGSMGSTRLNDGISAMVASPTGAGYLMVGFDGGIFTFGDVPFHGSLGSNPPDYPIWSAAVVP